MFVKILSKSIILGFGAVLFFSPILVSAITCPPTGFTIKDQICVPNNPFQTGGGVASSESYKEIIPQVIKTLLLVSGRIAILFIILGGFRYMSSRDNADSAKKARAMIVNAVIGLVVIILSYAIVLIVTNVLNNTRV